MPPYNKHRMTDAITPFLFEHHNVRGAYVEIETGVADMLGHRDYPPDVHRLIGEACAAAPLLAATLQRGGLLNIQFQGGGPLKLLVAQVDPDLNVRGMAKADAGASGTLEELMQGGVLGLLLEPSRVSEQRYQGLVEVRGDSLARALEGYFEQSEQLGTRLCLSAAPERLAGILIQRLPASAGAPDDVHWEHLNALFGTLGPAELAAQPVESLLLKVFAQESIRVFRPRPVHLVCRCSHASISGMLVSLGAEELSRMQEEQEPVDVTCEFCGRVYRYSPADLQNLSAAVRAGEPPTARH
jgi:molecular chaperone Hsp33